MTSPAPRPLAPNDRLYAVEADLDRIVRHLALLRDQLAELRTSGPAPAAPRVRVTPPTPAVVPPTPTPTPPAAPQTPWWQREGAVSRVLSAAGAGVFLIGISLSLLLAIQYGVFGPVPRVVAGWVVSALLVIIGAAVHRRQPGNAGSVALAATGIAGGYLSLLAMTAIYGWLSAPLGFVVAAAVFALGVLLTRRWQSQALGVIVVFGVIVLAPAVGSEQLWVAAGFIVLVSLGAVLADPERRWSVLPLVRVVPAALVLSGIAAAGDNTGRAVVLAALAAGFTLITIAVELGLDRRAATSRSALHAVVVGAATLPALITPGLLFDDRIAAGCLAGTAVALIVLGILSRRRAARAVLLSAAALSVLAGLGYLDVERLWVLGALTVAAAYLACAEAFRQRSLGWVGLGVAAVGLVGYLPIVDLLVGGEVAAYAPTVVDVLAGAVGVAVMILAGRLISSVIDRTVRVLLAVVLWAAGLLMITGFAVTAGVLLGAGAGHVGTGFLAGHAAATVIWIVAAAWLLMRRVARASAPRGLGIGIAGLAVAKLLIFDLSTLDGLTRVSAFVITGAVLLVVGTLYRRSRRPVGGFAG